VFHCKLALVALPYVRVISAAEQSWGSFGSFGFHGCATAHLLIPLWMDTWAVSGFGLP
jgi:hypothetical protein